MVKNTDKKSPYMTDAQAFIAVWLALIALIELSPIALMQN
jgi:hypothetical protein